MYKNTNELPKNVKHVLPPRALEIYRRAFNSAWQTYKDPKKRKDGTDQEKAAHKVAWSAVKREYAKTREGLWKRGGN